MRPVQSIVRTNLHNSSYKQTLFLDHKLRPSCVLRWVGLDWVALHPYLSVGLGLVMENGPTDNFVSSTSAISRDVNPTGTIHASFDSRWSVIPSGCRTGLECSTATCSEHAVSSRLPPRTEDRSVPVVIPWCDLTMYCALSACQSLSADLSPCTGCYKLILLTLYGGPAAAVR